MPFSGDIAEDHVRRIAQLASQAETAERQELYVWSNTAEA
jgi:hypothetical protein